MTGEWWATPLEHSEDQSHELVLLNTHSGGYHPWGHMLDGEIVCGPQVCGG